MTDEQKAKCHEIADYYRSGHQALKAIEEMSELQKELCKFVSCDDGDINRIIEELADVTIMIEQMRYYFDTHSIDVPKIIDTKLDRQLKRMESENDA